MTPLRVPRRTPPAVPMHDLSGRVCVVTGASSGIGLETAKGLAARGATVCLVGRDPARTAAALEEVRGVGGPEPSALTVDFSRIADVRRLADGLLRRLPRLHVLINNAGQWTPHRELGEGGIERTFLVNQLAPSCLTRGLLDLLRASAPARIVTVSSRLHEREARLRFEDVRRAAPYEGLAAYRQSKLANVLFAGALARRLVGDGVTSCSVHPGDVATDVVRDSRALSLGLRWVGRRYLLTPEEGARTSLHAAAAPELAGVTGRYYASCREAQPSLAARDADQAERLWVDCERLLS